MCDINSLIGKKYAVDGGDGINTFNCATLVRYVTGIDVSIIPTCESGNKFEIMKTIIANKKHFEIIDEPAEGCIVALSQLNKPHHVGVWLNGGVLHASHGVGVAFSTLQNLKDNGFKYEFGVLKNV